MKEFKVFAFVLMFCFSGFTTLSLANDSNVPSPNDKIFWHLDGSYSIVYDNDPCDKTYVERLDGSGYDLVMNSCD